MAKKDKDSDKNLFSKLADLFRSGPVVKRKIKSMDTRIAMPDKLDSSSIEIFQKTTSQLYSAITSNAYNNSERLMRYNDFCFTADTLVATPDIVGYKSIKEITDLWNQGVRELYTFSYDHKSKSVVASKITGAKNNGIKKIMEVHLDDGSIIKCTPDHRFMLKDGTYLEAKDLKQSMALMRFSRKNFNTPYKYIQTKSRGWKPEHTLIAEMKYERLIKENEHVHHLDFTPKNNLPSNLIFMNASEHHSYHMRINNLRFLNVDNRKKLSEIMKLRWSENGDLRLNLESTNKKLKNIRSTNAIKLNKEFKPGRFNKGRKDQVGLNNANADKTITYQIICNNYENGITLKNLAKKLNITTGKVRSRLKYEGYTSYKDFTEKYENHKVLKIVDLNQFEEVFDIEVQKYHNFALAKEDGHGIVFVHNCEMEQTAEIAAALDIWADETCAIDSKGKALHIYSENAQIKKLLDELFYDTINLDFNLRMWARNLCKYGDFVAFIDVHPHFGILNVIPIPINEIEREEGYDKDDPLAVRYRWVSRGNQILENWQIIHMRLLGNDMFLPYGSSVIEAARRIWRQLILIEDAMLVYRIVRAPDRRVFYIDVGNIEPDQIPNYVEQQKSALRSNQVIDRNTGRVDLRYNPMPVHWSTPVPLLDGRTLTIKELSDEYNLGKTNWVYSVQDDTKKIVPGKVVWCGKNYTAKSLTKVWLDDGSYITTAPEHPFVMRDGSRKRADELNVGDSLMSAYRDINNKGYERIVEPDGKLVSTHVMTARDAHKEKWESTDQRVVHHLHPENSESNKRDNRPENLFVMNFWEHRKMHADHCNLTLNRPELLEQRRIKRIAFNKSPEKRKRTAELNKLLGKAQKMGASYNGTELHASHNEIRRATLNKLWAEKKEERSLAMQWIIPNEVVSFVFDQIKSNPKIKREDLTQIIRNNSTIIEILKNANVNSDRDVSKFHVNAIVSKINRMGCIDKMSYGEFRKFAIKNTVPVNHQVVKIETITDANDDVYCMTVVGSNGEDDRHNFAVNGLGGQNNHKLLKSLIFVLNSVDEDFFIPVRGGDTGTKIDTLAGGQNTAAVEDVEYIQKKLFAALKIPKAYLGFDEALSSKATLAQEDIRFSRSVQMVQRTIVSELNKLAIIHLFAHGFTGEDLINFTLKLSNPSSVAQQQKLELFKSKFEIAALAPEGLLSKEFILKNIIELTDEEINDVQNGLIDDKEFAAKLEAAGVQAGGTPGGEAGGEAGGLQGGDMGGAPPGGEAGGEAGGETPPPENAGKSERDGLLIASTAHGKKPNALLDIDSDDIDFSERNSKINRDFVYAKNRVRSSRKQNIGKPDTIGMLSAKPNKNNYDLSGLKGLTNDLNPSFLNENFELKNTIEKLPDANTVKPNLTSDIRLTLSALESKFSNIGNKSNNKILTENDDFSELFEEEEFEIEK